MFSSKRDANRDRIREQLIESAQNPEAARKFFELRESGYTGWIDQDGNKAACPMCESMSCTRPGFSGRCN